MPERLRRGAPEEFFDEIETFFVAELGHSFPLPCSSIPHVIPEGLYESGRDGSGDCDGAEARLAEEVDAVEEGDEDGEADDVYPKTQQDGELFEDDGHPGQS